MGETFVGIWLISGLVLASPLILAAMGGYTSERAGVVNIALEGLMLTSACATALVSTKTGDAWMGVGAGLLAATLLSLVHWAVTQVYRADQVVSGTAINALALGGTGFTYAKFFDPAAAGIPILPLAFYQGLAVALPVLLFLHSRFTRGGLRLLAVGSDPDRARLAGVSAVWVRLGGLIATGVCCGLSGAMIVSNSGHFTNSMTAGRGFIALAALILGGWRPVPAALAAVAFGLFEALQLQLQGTRLFGAGIPSEVWSSVPYLVTLVALAGLLGRHRAPAGLGEV